MLQSLFSKAAGLIKKRPQDRCFLVKFAKILRTTFSENTSGGCFWSYNDMKLVKSETSERYHLCSTKKAICSRNIITLWFQALVMWNKSNFWSVNTMCTHYIASELHPSLPHLFTILCSILCFLIIFLLQILFGKLETQASKLHYRIILQLRLKK